MYGMPHEGKDENHRMHGLYMFKANFGGKIIHRTGSWNVPVKKIYCLFAFAFLLIFKILSDNAYMKNGECSKINFLILTVYFCFPPFGIKK